MNQCIHGIDLLRWMMGNEVDEVYGATRQQQNHYLEAEGIGMAVVKFKNGAIATIEGTINVYPKNLEETLYLFGETGTVKIGGKGTKIWHFCHVQKGAIIGAGCSFGQNVNVANNVVIGNGVKVQNNVSIYEGVVLENDVYK